jgi:hypothetical protein
MKSLPENSSSLKTNNMKKRKLIILLALIAFQTEISSQSIISRETMAPMVPDSVITWKFNSQGDSALNTRMTYRYDAHLNVIESEKFTREQALNLWVPNRREEWEFDNQDRQTLWAIYEWDNNDMAYKGFIKQTNIFDNHGNRVEYHYYTWDHNLTDWKNDSWDLYVYDDQDKITRGDHLKWNYEAAQWDTASYDIYEYGDDDLLQHLTIWEPDEDFGGIIYPHERRDYQHDASGNEIEWVGQIYNPGTELWYFTVKLQYAYDVQNRKTNSMYSEYDEGEEKWINKDKDEWGWDDSDSLTLYAYYRIGEDLVTWYPQLKAEKTYNSHGKLIHYRGYSGNDQAQWVPTYERRYPYKNDTLLLADSLFQWIEADQVWELVDCNNYQYDSLFRMHTDSYYAWVVHTHQLELSTRGYYFYSETAGVEEHGGMEAGGHGGVEVWPNPTSGKFQITSTKFQTNSKTQNSKLKIEIVDLFGKVVLEEEKRRRGEGEIGCDVSALPAGIYFVRIHLENQIIVKKIIKL